MNVSPVLYAVVIFAVSFVVLLWLAGYAGWSGVLELIVMLLLAAAIAILSYRTVLT